MTVRKRKVTHKPVTKTASGGSEARQVEIEAGINMTEAPQGETGPNVETDVDVSPNEHGSMTVRKRKVTHVPVSVTTKGGTALYEEEAENSINDTELPTEGPQKGKTTMYRATPNEHGSYSVQKVIRTAKAAHETKTWTTEDDNYTYTHTVDVYRNAESVPSVPNKKYQANISLSINEFGLIDAIVTTVERREIHGDGQQSYSKEGKATRWLIYQTKEGKLCKRKVTANVRKRREKSGVFHTPEIGESGFGFNSHDDGSYGVIYTDITLGEEIEIK